MVHSDESLFRKAKIVLIYDKYSLLFLKFSATSFITELWTNKTVVLNVYLQDL